MALLRAPTRPACAKIHPHRTGPCLNSARHLSATPALRATLIKRPRRPYTFTQLVTLSDGSTYLHRTTSPAPVLRSSKDARSSQLWNPSSQKLRSVEADDAGRLRAFRERFGRGWDAVRDEGKIGEEAAREEEEGAEEEDNLMDLITGYAREGEAEKGKKGKKGKKGGD